MPLLSASFSSKGSIVVNHEVMVRIHNTGNATEEYNTVLKEVKNALNEAADCDESDPGFCKNVAPTDFKQFYTYHNTSATGIVCVSVCDSRHQNHYTCQLGHCSLPASGPRLCPISDSHWFLGSHCQNKISKAGVYAGVSLTTIVLLAAVIGLLIYQLRTKRLTEQRERDSKEDLVSQWFEDDFKWPNADRGASSHPETFNERGYGDSGAQERSAYERNFSLSLGNLNTQMAMKIERPRIKQSEI
ncbi:mucin-3B-like [Acipenser ruthenus]|uniref:mucin-3B-like n=1 Tax=Acipenser ruthenus TaxID=7906 RepID=UPI0027407611|nr:mucin-3B-like [Acipenser ruthenus]